MTIRQFDISGCAAEAVRKAYGFPSRSAIDLARLRLGRDKVEPLTERQSLSAQSRGGIAAYLQLALNDNDE